MKFFLAEAVVALALLSTITNKAKAMTNLAPELREEGVLYLDDNLNAPLTAPVTSLTLVYSDRNLSRVSGSLSPGQILTLLGLADDDYFIGYSFNNNNLMGWIKPSELPGKIDPRWIQDAKQEQEHRIEIALAIASKKVILGMMPDQVLRSLGKPDRVQSTTAADSKTETWIYSTYREQPEMAYSIDSAGRPLVQNYYIKVPVGTITINFSNNRVRSIDEIRSVGLGETTTPSIYGQRPHTVLVVPGSETSSSASVSVPVEAPLPSAATSATGPTITFGRSASSSSRSPSSSPR